jgi:hypothetical protein
MPAVNPNRVAAAATTSTRAVTTAAPSANEAALAKKATSWIKANSGEGWGKKFPPVDSGNRGVSAFVPSQAQAKALLADAKELYPGLPAVQAAKLDPAKNQLVVVLTSDDEPALHLALQDKKTGAMRYLGEANSYDLPTKDGDLGEALTRVSKGAKWLPLGEGSAEPNWWK